MSYSNDSHTDHNSERGNKCCGGFRSRQGNWSKANTIVMVLGFIFFWPIGLFLLFWIKAGRNVQELPAIISNKWSNLSTDMESGMFKKWGGKWCDDDNSDNVVFNEYQKAQYDRIREIKDEIRSRSKRFEEFRASAKRREDEKEFNEFMANKPDPING